MGFGSFFFTGILGSGYFRNDNLPTILKCLYIYYNYNYIIYKGFLVIYPFLAKGYFKKFL